MQKSDMHVTAPPKCFIVFGCEVRKVRVQMPWFCERSALCCAEVTFIATDGCSQKGGCLLRRLADVL